MTFLFIKALSVKKDNCRARDNKRLGNSYGLRQAPVDDLRDSASPKVASPPGLLPPPHETSPKGRPPSRIDSHSGELTPRSCSFNLPYR